MEKGKLNTKRILVKVSKILLWIIGSIVGLVIVLILLLRLPSVQNFVIHKVTASFSKKTGTRIEIGSLYISFPKSILIENLYAEDKSQDTLIAAGKIKVDLNLLSL